MGRLFLMSTWTAAAMAISLLAGTFVRADNEPDSKNRRSGGDGAKSNNNSGRKNNNSSRRNSTGDGEKPGAGGSGNIINKGGSGKVVPGGGKSGSGGSGGVSKKKAPDKSAWKSSNKDGWHKNGWNSNFNSQHQSHRHGYWNNGIWIAPWIIANNRPWVYLQPVQPIASGQKWLGVTYEPYDGGGAYVNGIYEGSPAQQIGLEVGDVIVSLDGVNATQLGSVIQASDGNVILQVLSGRTGDLVELPVNLIR